MSETETKQAASDEITGISGLGPVRRRLLAEAGITTRSALAAATVEQIISITAMSRVAAEQVHAAVSADSVPTSEASAPARAELPEIEDITPEPASDAEPDSVTRPEAARLERAMMQAQTAIADASRHTKSDSKLSGSLVRLASLADALPQRLGENARAGVVRRVAERMEEIAERLESLAGKARGDKKTEPLGSKREKRLRQRIKRTRDSIKRTLKTTAAKAGS